MYSIGSNAELSFEEEFVRRAKCSVFTFDPTVDVKPEELPAGVRFFKVGIAGINGTQSVGPVRTLRGLMELVGHGHHQRIDVLKMDVEGAEFEALDAILREGMPDIGQILVEIHAPLNHRQQFMAQMQRLYEAGFWIFHKDPNLIGGAPYCELALVNVLPASVNLHGIPVGLV